MKRVVLLLLADLSTTLAHSSQLSHAVDNVRIGTSSGVAAPPTIICPAPQVFECSNDNVITLSVTVQDSSANLVQVVWVVDGIGYQVDTLPVGAALTPTNVFFTASFGLGEHSIGVSVTDADTIPARCSTTVTIRDTTPPTITCPPDIIISADFGCSAVITQLGNPVVSDNCGIMSITNDLPEIILRPGRPPRPPPQRQISFPVGTNLVTWIATDTGGNTNSCTQRVIVLDTKPPGTLRGFTSATPNHLWPPNERMIPVTIFLVAFDECGEVTSKITAVHVKWPHSRVARKPNRRDVQITGDLTLLLRASDRRFVYIIDVTCTDSHGNSSVISVEVPVMPDPDSHRDPR